MDALVENFIFAMHMCRGKIGSGCYTQLHFRILGHALMVVNHHVKGGTSKEDITSTSKGA